MWNPEEPKKSKAPANLGDISKKELYTGDDFIKDLVYAKNPLLAPLPKDESPSPQVNLTTMSEEEVFINLFLESEMVRKAHGFSKEGDKYVLKDKTWIDTTCNQEKKVWIRTLWGRLMKEGKA